ncbi:transcriptional regulator [Abyssisolibacter fermentans]|uniref:transcriptional regulator n=1 Tax=Abyssisolibacter fermentans TaxID=1766203 RepID=UPI000830B17B|nr:transcriptional regulator [Abyssisolibacter fermentans]
MYKFGDYLETLLIIKQIDKKLFSTMIGINRSQLYRFLRNEQVPTLELLEIISSKLNLRVSEYNKMLESYECSLYGTHIIESRKIIHNILSYYVHNKDYSYDITLRPDNNMFFSELQKSTILPLSSKNEVILAICKLLEMVKNTKTKTTIKIILQPEMTEIMNLLSSLLKDLKQSSKDITIEHIIRFRSTFLDSNKCYNLKILETLLPLASYQNIYKTYYTMAPGYSDGHHEFLPALVCMNNEMAITISSDCQKGIFYSNGLSEVIDVLIDEYDKVKTDCLPLFINTKDEITFSSYLLEFEQNISADSYILQPENCFLSFPTEIIKNKCSEINAPKQFADLLIDRKKIFESRLKNNTVVEIIPLKALDSFVKKRKYLLLGEIVLNIEEISSILENLLYYIEKKNNYFLYLMKDNNEFTSIKSSFYILGEELLYIIPSYANYETSDNTIIRESEIIRSFKDFLRSYFKKNNSIICQKEVADIIRKKINDLK